MSGTKKSGTPGVTWDKANKNWRIRVRKDGKNINLGARKSKEIALYVLERYYAENPVNVPLVIDGKVSYDYLKVY